MSAIDNLIATAVARTSQVRVCARGDLADRHVETAAELQRWLEVEGDDALAEDSNVRHLKDQLLAIEEEMETSSVTIRVATIPAYRWANLIRLHAPTREQRAQGFDNDPDTFPTAAVAACAVEPKISEDQARQLRDTLHQAEWNKLWIAVLLLNTEETPTPKLGAATAALLASAPSSTPASGEGSLAEPSSDGSGTP